MWTSYVLLTVVLQAVPGTHTAFAHAALPLFKILFLLIHLVNAHSAFSFNIELKVTYPSPTLTKAFPD